VPSDKSKRDRDQKPEATPPRPFSSPGFAKVIQSIADQLLDQLHDQQQFVAELNPELEREPDLKRPAPQRSLESDPKLRKTDIKPRARVAEIAKPAATSEKAAADPKQLSKADDQDAAIEERKRLWQKVEKGIDLSNAETQKVYQIGKTELHKRLNDGDLTRGKRGFVTSASIKAQPPGFIDRNNG
jgi:hypothetical protein